MSYMPGSPGTDVCQLPSGPVPPGKSVDFTITDLQAVANGVTITLTIIATIFVTSRLYTNVRKLHWSDNSRFFRHTWHLPLCWITGQYDEWNYIWSILSIFSLAFSKIATLLLFLQIFTVSGAMRVAIHVGIWTTFVVYLTSIIISTFIIVPHNGESWDDAIEQRAGRQQFSLCWGISLSSAVTLIDLYIVILPIPSLWRLRMSTRRKIQITAVFLVGIIAVVASVTSLVFKISIFRSQSVKNDYTYFSAVISFLLLVEMDASLIIPCSVAFAHTMRSLVSQNHVWARLSSTGRGQRTGIHYTPTNKPHRHPAHRDPIVNHRGLDWEIEGRNSEMSDAWLMSNVAVDIEAPEAALTITKRSEQSLKVTRTDM
ncbi:hypothetical protein F5Y18DRAFT_440370 [Xylariaceae sp. FL1019]|nr:hypothetical protein F5Y18DRAFT_440370 [Xylariaceae sp. FL1019]